MSDIIKKSGVFKTASVMLLIEKVFVIISVITLSLALIIIAMLSLMGTNLILQFIPENEGALTTATLAFISATVIAILIFELILIIAYLIVISNTRKKMLKATQKKQYMGWAIASVIFAVLFFSIIGFVGAILSLSAPSRDFSAE